MPHGRWRLINQVCGDADASTEAKAAQALSWWTTKFFHTGMQNVVGLGVDRGGVRMVIDRGGLKARGEGVAWGDLSEWEKRGIGNAWVSRRGHAWEVQGEGESGMGATRRCGESA
jgi:hypothetical protein